ncbi:zinc-ribbon domain-containing protein [Pseudoclavibacter helvolus]|uniref:zinc-ribbon domain-containing protein n=1 Tax=Pseudoclavibacter helvolus TaxID=255205 RepID=UPI00160E6B71
MTTLVCGNCQAQLEADGSRFCMRCGAPLMPARSISMPLEGTAEHEAVPPTEPHSLRSSHSPHSPHR